MLDARRTSITLTANGYKIAGPMAPLRAPAPSMCLLAFGVAFGGILMIWGGSSQVTVTKVKAHATRCAVLDGHVSASDKAAHDLADAGAKLAAQQHPSSPEVEKRCERTRLTMTMIAKFLARIHCHVLDNIVDVTPRSQRLKPTRARLATLRIVKQTAHRLVWEQGRWRCARCLRSSANPCVIRATPLQARLCSQDLHCPRWLLLPFLLLEMWSIQQKGRTPAPETVQR